MQGAIINDCRCIGSRYQFYPSVFSAFQELQIVGARPAKILRKRSTLLNVREKGSF